MYLGIKKNLIRPENCHAWMLLLTPTPFTIIQQNNPSIITVYNSGPSISCVTRIPISCHRVMI